MTSLPGARLYVALTYVCLGLCMGFYMLFSSLVLVEKWDFAPWQAEGSIASPSPNKRL